MESLNSFARRLGGSRRKGGSLGEEDLLDKEFSKEIQEHIERELEKDDEKKEENLTSNSLNSSSFPSDPEDEIEDNGGTLGSSEKTRKRLSFDQLPKPPQNPISKKVSGDLIDKELGLVKNNYWEEEGSKIFEKWGPATKQDEEKQSLFSRSLKRLGVKQSPQSPNQTPLVSEAIILFDPNYKFFHADSPDNLVFAESPPKDGIPVIRGGALAKLVERLTYDKYVDTNYLQQFLLTYRTFTTPNEFFALLIERYNVPNPIKATPEQLKKFQAQKQVIRLRVFNVVKTWVDKHFYDFENSKQLVSDLMKFTDLLSSTGMEKSATFLTEFLTRKRVVLDEKKPEVIEIIPTSSLHDCEATVELLKLNALELAKQMTLIEFEMYHAIIPSEFTNQGWAKGTKEEKERNAPHVLPLIDWFNQVSSWVATTIVFEEDLETRRDLLVYFIHLANKCKELHNFNGMMEVISGVTATSTYRLKKTWALVDRNTLTIFEELNTLLSRDNNFANFRKALHKVQPPALPYLGVYLTDMIFVDQGNSDTLPGTKLINFQKRRLLSFVIREIQQYQQLPYTYAHVDYIAHYLRSLKFKSEDECYVQSLKIEPREEPAKQAPKVTLSPGYDQPEEFEFDYPEHFPFKDFDSEENLLFMPFDETRQRFQVRGGTLEKLIERLTYPKYPDPEYLLTFLMTYRSFCTPKQLFDLLLQRFYSPLPINCLEEDLKKYKDQRLTPIRLRVLNVFKNWLDKHFSDFMEDRSLVSSFLQFVKKNSEIENELAIEKTLEQLKKLIQRKLKEQLESAPIEEIARGEIEGILQHPADDSINLYMLQPAEFAQQLALLHKRLCLSIDVVKMFKNNFEFARDFGPGGNLSVAINYNFKTTQGSGIILMNLFSEEVERIYAQSEQLKEWVTSSLIEASDLSQRIEVITRFIEMAETSRQLSNYHGMVSILNGLSSTVSKAFKKAWSVYPSKPHLVLLQDMMKLIQKVQGSEMDIEYMKRVRKQTNIATVLYLIPHLEKLTQYVMEPDMIPGTQMINLDKRRKIANILNEISMYQKKAYDLPETVYIQKYLLELPPPISDAEAMALAIAANEMDETGKEDITGLTFSGFGKISRKKSLDSLASSQLEDGLLHSNNSRTSLSSSEKDSILSVNKELRDALVNLILGKQFDPEIIPSQEVVEKLKKEVQEEILSMTLTWSSLSEEKQSAHLTHLIQKTYPDWALEDFKHEDEEGFVYGWKSEISLKAANTKDGLILVKYQPHISLSDISIAKRENELYNRISQTKAVNYVILTPLCFVSKQLMEIATTHNILLHDPHQ